jgi:hypothetical protein
MAGKSSGGVARMGGMADPAYKNDESGLLADPERGHKLFIKPLKLIEVMK